MADAAKLALDLPRARPNSPPVIIQLGLGNEQPRAERLRAVLSQLGHSVFVTTQPDQGWASVGRDADVLEAMLHQVTSTRARQASIVAFSKGGHTAFDVIGRAGAFERMAQVVSVGVPYGGVSALGTVSAVLGARLSQSSSRLSRAIAASPVARRVDTTLGNVVRATARDANDAFVPAAVDDLMYDSKVVRATQSRLTSLEALAALKDNRDFRLAAIHGRRTGAVSDGTVTSRSAMVPERPPFSRNIEIVDGKIDHGTLLDRPDVIGQIAKALAGVAE